MKNKTSTTTRDNDESGFGEDEGEDGEEEVEDGEEQEDGEEEDGEEDEDEEDGEEEEDVPEDVMKMLMNSSFDDDDNAVVDEEKIRHYEKENPGQIVLNNDDGLYGGGNSGDDVVVVRADDIIMRRARSRPIVIPEYKLVFFHVAKVASTTFIMMFQRLLNITSPNATIHLHHPQMNQLQYLNPNTPEHLAYANQVITDPNWTKAIFVRNPHERLVSAYLDKGSMSDFQWIHWSCCPQTEDCMKKNKGNRTYFEKFVFDVLPNCSDVHWVPQYRRMEPKYWKYINFVGHMESLDEDSKALLQRIGAYEKYQSMPRHRLDTDDSFSYGTHHATNARKRNFTKYFTNKRLYDRISKYYEEDYGNPLLRLSVKPYEEIV